MGSIDITSVFEDQKDFMILGDQTVSVLNSEQSGLYHGLIEEEYCELMYELDGMNYKNNAKSVKETIDCIVVLSGYLLSLGIDAQKAWDIVHKNNMQKVMNKMQKDDSGKIKKTAESIALKERMMADLGALFEQ